MSSCGELIVCLGAIPWKEPFLLPAAVRFGKVVHPLLLCCIITGWKASKSEWLAGAGATAHSKLSILSNGYTPLVQLRTADCQAQDDVLPCTSKLFSKRKFTKYIDVYANRIKTIGNLTGEERNPDESPSIHLPRIRRRFPRVIVASVRLPCWA